MGGPKSWNGAKRRAKRPQSAEAKRTAEQVVGKRAQKLLVGPSGGGVSKQQPMRKAPKLQGSEKRLRTLNKLLKDIEALQAREAAGEELDEQQLAKLDRLEDVLTEMDSLMAGGPG
jgi:uncharacterized protein with WD repeat